ncbi:MAG: adenylate/guanylate cyclase domain-containing protein [Chloroflexi bacterium]|nr:adenylate/guanylate cyclase domain-containing protein [Chloroflexota bacterium]
MFTDIEASTRLIQFLGERYADLLAQHHQILRQAILTWDGMVVDTQGDAFFAVFSQAQDALAAAVSIQRTLATHTWPDELPVRVRMGLHTGEPTLTADNYYVGLDIHRAARVCSAGHGGQILITQATCNLVLADLPYGVSLRDLGEHRLKDLDRPEQLYQVVMADLPSDFPAVRSLELFIHNLPTPLTSFIGREKEIIEVGRLLDRFRLITLTGPGGTGKTRLAIQVANEQLDSFADGIRFVELAPVADSSHLPQTVAAALGLREEPGQPLIKTLSDHLRHKTMLLVLDNCEHLVDAAANLVAHLLSKCPSLRILTSSREPLGLTGEHSYAVPTLSMPPSGSRHLPPLETLTQYEAVRLFIERAEAVFPEFTVTNNNAPAVAHICHRLDGIPLAIELAAARVRTLTVDQIAARLDDRFRLLKGNNQRAVPRQKTLRALIDWSYDLLSETEQILLRRLSVFAGGWSLQAAEQIVADDTFLPTDEIMDGLDRLAHKSLIIAIREPEQVVRFQFLDTIRQYAREKLIEAKEMDDTCEKHLLYFLHQTQLAEPRLRGPEQLQWWQWLSLELDNFRAAMNWAEQQELGNSPWLPQAQRRTDLGLQLAAALWWFWFLNGHLNEACNRLENFIGRTPPDVASMSRNYCQAVWRCSCLSYFANRYARAFQLAAQAIPLCEHHNEPDGKAIAWFVQANVARSRQEYKKADQLYQQSYALFQQTGNEWGLRWCLI